MGEGAKKVSEALAGGSYIKGRSGMLISKPALWRSGQSGSPAGVKAILATGLAGPLILGKNVEA